MKRVIKADINPRQEVYDKAQRLIDAGIDAEELVNHMLDWWPVDEIERCLDDLLSQYDMLDYYEED